MRRSPAPTEPIGRTGAVLLSANHLALLHGLYDRPAGRARSTAELLCAGLPYLRLFRPDPRLNALAKSKRTLHHAWVTRRRAGRCVTWTLTPRGRGIVERTVPAHVRGVGPYLGLERQLARVALDRRQRSIETRWAEARSDPSLAPLIDVTEAFVEAWTRHRSPAPKSDAWRLAVERRYLVAYVRDHVLRHRVLPTGIHELVHRKHGCDLRVDFDELHRLPG